MKSSNIIWIFLLCELNIVSVNTSAYYFVLFHFSSPVSLVSGNSLSNGVKKYNLLLLLGSPIYYLFFGDILVIFYALLGCDLSHL